MASSSNSTEGPSAVNEVLLLILNVYKELGFDSAIIIPSVKAQVIQAVLSTGLFGLYTVLALTAAYLACRKGLMAVAKAVMLLAIASIYISTTIYWATVIHETFTAISFLANSYYASSTTIAEIIRTLSPSASTGPPGGSPLASTQNVWGPTRQKCTGTATLTISVTLGDAIVWWRVLVLWKTRIVRMLCILLISATFVTGVVATTHACLVSGIVPVIGATLTGVTLTSDSLYSGDKWGLATCILSLVTNVAATSLIGYKAWHHRRLVAQHLRMGSTRTRVERTLTLFVESGSVYCILWIFVVAYQAGSNASSFIGSTKQVEESEYTRGFYYVVEGCLIPLIGIYPTLIIILVALDQSHCDTNFTYGSKVAPPIMDRNIARPMRSRSPIQLNSVIDITRRGATHQLDESKDAGVVDEV
ncbi:hypothetical protein C8Q80DRAFT_1186454 [Daedaleopsis nitida]|nr:hypothetical protein C8Q80DRAFT_1186454 [Daedaleopsis nitida]